MEVDKSTIQNLHNRRGKLYLRRIRVGMVNKGSGGPGRSLEQDHASPWVTKVPGEQPNGEVLRVRGEDLVAAEADALTVLRFVGLQEDPCREVMDPQPFAAVIQF